MTADEVFAKAVKACLQLLAGKTTPKKARRTVERCMPLFQPEPGQQLTEEMRLHCSVIEMTCRLSNELRDGRHPWDFLELLGPKLLTPDEWAVLQPQVQIPTEEMH